MNFLKSLTFLVIISIVFTACSTSQYSPVETVTLTHPDSLLVDLVTYIGKRPRGVLQQDRHNPTHRPYFEHLSQSFEFTYYFYNDETNKNYFYLIRPARNHSGNVNRGVGGWFILNDSNKISQLSEVFNTHIRPVEILKEQGLSLFKEMINSGVSELCNNHKEIIEWPDSRTVYNDSINEWIYK